MQHAEGNLNLDEPWKIRGRAKLLSKEDIDNVTNDLEEFNASSVGEEDLIKVIRTTKKSKLESNGLIPLSATRFTPSVTTLNNYKVLILIIQAYYQHIE